MAHALKHSLLIQKYSHEPQVNSHKEQKQRRVENLIWEIGLNEDSSWHDLQVYKALIFVSIYMIQAQFWKQVTRSDRLKAS